MKDNNRTITNNQELAETFYTFLINITQNLKIDDNLVSFKNNLDTSDPVLKSNKKYEKQSSINTIKEKIKNKNMSFSFSFINNKTILNKLHKLDTKKLVRNVVFQSK